MVGSDFTPWLLEKRLRIRDNRAVPRTVRLKSIPQANGSMRCQKKKTQNNGNVFHDFRIARR